MTHTAQPMAGSVTKQQGVRKIPVLPLITVFLSVAVATIPVFQLSKPIISAMQKAGWDQVYGPEFFLFNCLGNVECQSAYLGAVAANYPLVWLIPLIASMAFYVHKAKPDEYVVKDPGMAWWAQAEDKGIEQYLSHGKGDNKLLGYIGHLMSVNRDGDIDYKKTIPLYVRQNALAENVMVLGGVGAGKTRGYFRPLIMLAAHLGFNIIVFDLKYPQADSGFFDMVGYWKKKGRDVMLFTPFSENTMRLPLLETITDYASALSMASTVMPPPEYGPEPGKHYRDRDRGVLAAFILAVAQSDNASFSELLRFSRFTPEEMKNWFQKQVDLNEEGEVVQNLKGIFAQGDKEVASVLQGIKNALKIFYDPRVARATQSLEGENMNVRAAFRNKPTMIYVGIQQEFMMEGQGVILLQLVKRYIDAQIMKEAEAQGGRFKRHVAYILDEFPSFGQLPYMMRSLGVLRSFNVSHHIGLQNLAQLAVVYGNDYSQALTTSVIGRKIFYPLAIDAEEREVLSKQIGDTTVYEFSDTDSRRAFMGNQFDDASRSGVSMKKVARPLLPIEEFAHFRPMEAVITSRGVNPVRTFMPAIEDEYLDGPDIPKGIKNGLYALYRQVNPEGENMGHYTTKLLESGAFGIQKPVTTVDRKDRWRASVRQWLDNPEVTLRLAGEKLDRIYLEFHGERSEEEAAALGHYFQADYVASHSGTSILIKPGGLHSLDPAMQEEVNQEAMMGGLKQWLTKHASEVDGSPERAALTEPPEAQAILDGDTVYLRLKVAETIFGLSPKSLTKRINTANYVRVNRADPHEIYEAVKRELAEAQEHGSNPLTASEPDSEPDSEPGAKTPVPKTPAKAKAVSASAAQTPSWMSDEEEEEAALQAQETMVQSFSDDFDTDDSDDDGRQTYEMMEQEAFDNQD